ncbi:ABC-type multidrug transport system, permease component YbhS (plasmid) [Peptoclostridium acidaminophilum DSM 3953]|uniref:Transport permease protein n=2 Tax=Peptoclostridium acidaminophilum TaxID=1731 RepID=W8UA07_PEPAC|nr:ABC-type multidrug transport system, permease component YbhS [Peptoclostridium acidaminophilum DSM 3953]
MDFNIKRILAIIKKEFSQIKRDKRTIAIIIMLPIMELLLFGYAASTSVDHIPTVVLNNDIGSESRALLDNLSNSQYFDLDYHVTSMEDVKKYIDYGYAKAGFVIPPDFSEDIEKEKTAQIQLIVDGTDPTTAQTILSSAGGVFQSMSVEIIQETVGTAMSQPLDLMSRVWYNPDMSSINFNIPGLIGVILQTVTLMLTSFSIVRERERGTMEQLLVTPITNMELMIGKIIPYVIIGFVDIVLALALSVFWFRVPIAGSIILLLIFSTVFLFGALGVGLIISIISKSQLQAMQLSMFMIMPNLLLSGYMFPREAMPNAIYGLSTVLPLTYFIKVLRGIILKGNGFIELYKEFVILVAFGMAFLFIATIKFKKKID